MVDPEERLREIFQSDEVPQVSKKTLNAYRRYLVKELSAGCLVTGREDFNWEEIYVLGPGDPDEYKELKKVNPSYTDEYRVLKFLPKPSWRNDLLIMVERLSDGKQFELELSWLEVVDKNSRDFILLEDFGIWQVNW